MNFIPQLGISAPELGWVPSPSFVLRRQAILDRIRGWPPGSVLEMGCGSGAILYDLARLGFRGVGVETSEQAREVAQTLLADVVAFDVTADIPSAKSHFDYLLSFEVLEHIEDDRAALAEWAERMRPGGTCMLSVPAHGSRWNVTDVLAGHYRRYERADLLELIKSAGLRPIQITTCGWPASWMIGRLRNYVRIWQLRRQGIDPQALRIGDSELTARSGVDRKLEIRLFPLYGGAIGRSAFSMLCRLQRKFYDTDRGVSYVVQARRP